MKSKKFLIAVMICLLALFTGCSAISSLIDPLPEEYVDGVRVARDYPDDSLPIYDDAIVYAYEEDDGTIELSYGTEDDVDDVADFYEDIFDSGDLKVDESEDEKDSYYAKGTGDGFVFEINVEEASGKYEERAFAATATVEIEFVETEAAKEEVSEKIEEAATEEPVAEPTAEPAPQSALPLRVSAYGNNYVVNSYALGTDSQGNTTVIVSGSGFDMIPMRDMEWKIPVECAIISGGTEYTCISADMNATEVTYYFNSSASPDAIVFYPGDMPESRTVIDVGEEPGAASNPQPAYGKPEKLSLDSYLSEFNKYLDESRKQFPGNSILAGVGTIEKSDFIGTGVENQTLYFYGDLMLMLEVDSNDEVIFVMVTGAGFSGEDEMYNAILGFEQAALNALFQPEGSSGSADIAIEVLNASKSVNTMLYEGNYEIFVYVEDPTVRTLLVSFGAIS
ncbi:MAG: hypothetical protein JXN65_02330 [Clostridia bacterium]|nr:hypothetical protein [Clostridia bacterium]